MAQRIATLVGQFITLLHAEITQQLLVGLARNVLHTFMSTSGTIIGSKFIFGVADLVVSKNYTSPEDS